MFFLVLYYLNWDSYMDFKFFTYSPTHFKESNCQNHKSEISVSVTYAHACKTYATSVKLVSDQSVNHIHFRPMGVKDFNF